MEETRRHIIAINRLPARFPTHMQEGAFWESLGRAVATFGFLEEVMEKAIFSFTATRQYDESEIEQAYREWIPKLERSLSDPLGRLIQTYGKAVRENPASTITNLDDLLRDLRKVAEMRNILCHGSWRPPDPNGGSVPFFVNRRNEVVETTMNREYIDQVQRHTAELACHVINTVSHMGWRFPGSMGPGKAIWETS